MDTENGCEICGAAVTDVKLHREWHDGEQKRMSDVVEKALVEHMRTQRRIERMGVRDY